MREAPTQIIAFEIFSHARHVTNFRTAVAAQEICLQGTEGTNCFLTMNLSGAICIPQC